MKINRSFLQDIRLWLRLVPDFQQSLASKAMCLDSMSRYRLLGYDNFLFSIGSEISSNSKILVLGGYRGRTTERWLSQGAQEVTVFEPVSEFFEYLVKLFGEDRRVKLLNAAAGASDSSLQLSVQGDRTGALSDATKIHAENVKQIHFSAWLKSEKREFSITEINIEGGEYSLFESLESAEILRLGLIFLQTHKIENLERRQALLEEKLLLTHFRVIRLPLVWDVWVPRFAQGLNVK